MLLHTPLLLAALHTTQLQTVNLKPRPQLELWGQGFAHGEQSWQEVCVNQSSWSKLLAWLHCFQVPKCPIVGIRAPKTMPHCLGHVYTALCCDMQVCLPQENRNMWIKWARTCFQKGVTEKLQEIAQFLVYRVKQIDSQVRLWPVFSKCKNAS